MTDAVTIPLIELGCERSEPNAGAKKLVESCQRLNLAMCTPQACALPIIARSAQELAAKIQKKLELAIKAALCNCCNTNIVSLLRRLPITSTRENAHEVCSCITLREDRPQNPVSTSSAALRNACVIMRTKATKQFRTTFVQRPADLGSSGHERLDNELAIACVVVPVFCCQQLGGGKVSNFGLMVNGE